MKFVRYAPTYTRQNNPAAQTWTLAMDVLETETAFVLKASIPGVSPDDVEITFQDDVMTIAGERKADETIKADYHLCERHVGKFSRSLRFNTPVNSDNIEATYQHGVLTLNIPKAEAVKPKKIAIRSMIEG